MEHKTQQLLDEIDVPQQVRTPHEPKRRRRVLLYGIAIIVVIVIVIGELWYTGYIDFHAGGACAGLNEQQCNKNPKCYPNAVSGCANQITKPGDYCALEMHFYDCRDIPEETLKKTERARKDCRHAGGTWRMSSAKSGYCQCSEGTPWDGKNHCPK